MLFIFIEVCPFCSGGAPENKDLQLLSKHFNDWPSSKTRVPPQPCPQRQRLFVDALNSLCTRELLQFYTSYLSIVRKKTLLSICLDWKFSCYPERINWDLTFNDNIEGSEWVITQFFSLHNTQLLLCKGWPWWAEDWTILDRHFALENNFVYATSWLLTYRLIFKIHCVKVKATGLSLKLLNQCTYRPYITNPARFVYVLKYSNNWL